MKRGLLLSVLLIVLLPQSLWAMHLPEMLLPAKWAGLWFVFVAPFFFWGLHTIQRKSLENPRYKSMVALMGASVFIISCMPIPVPFVGACAHPCGTGLAALLIGPGPTVVLASIALVLQALFLSHGGLTTLGANLFSIGLIGAYAGYAIFWGARRLHCSVFTAAFLAGLISHLLTYVSISLVLGLGLQGSMSWETLFVKALTAFLPFMIPIGILEGILTASAYRFICAKIKMD
jgi:cobalt/nickel transport system permease protein